MTPEQDAADECRAALALIAATAEGDGGGYHGADVAALLGRGWQSSRRGYIAWCLAWWLEHALRRLGQDPAGTARWVIGELVAREARGAGPTSQPGGVNPQ